MNYEALCDRFRREFKRPPNKRERLALLDACDTRSMAQRQQQRGAATDYKQGGARDIRRSEAVSGGMAADMDRGMVGDLKPVSGQHHVKSGKYHMETRRNKRK